MKWVAVTGVLLFAGAIAAGIPWQSLAPWGFVLACPLMMAFMHGGHGHGQSHRHQQ